MKRISLLTIAILALVPSVSKASWRYYTPVRYRTRYSPYAADYHNSGLVPGYLRYSPYATGYSRSGLIPYWVRYSPYAVGYNRSGLVSDHGCYGYRHPGYLLYVNRQTCYSPKAANCNSCQPGQAFNPNNGVSFSEAKYDAQEQLRARKERIKKLISSRSQINGIRENDAKEIIYKYLKSKNIDFRTNRLLKVDNKTLSVDFLLVDKNTIIKYWNPEDIQHILQQPGCKKKVCEKYGQTWKDYCENFKASGGKVYEVKATDKEEILSQLGLCQELHEG